MQPNTRTFRNKTHMISTLNSPAQTTIANITIPMRAGTAPATVGPIPHRQESEKASPALVDKLIASINALDGVTVSTWGGYVGRDFYGEGASRWNAHVHHYDDGDHQDGSMHIRMPQRISAEIEAAGWGVRHPAYPVMLLVFSPRNEAEIETITKLVQLSYDCAKTG